MKVKILKSDDTLRISEGEIYEGQLYWLDSGKITLLRRIPDGYNPLCNEYLGNVKVLRTEDRYKVNVLNPRGKEVWKYCLSIDKARHVQQLSMDNGLSSSIFQKIDGKYLAI